MVILLPLEKNDKKTALHIPNNKAIFEYPKIGIVMLLKSLMAGCLTIPPQILKKICPQQLKTK
ncbi:hypothetical protein J2W48_002388 [Flavobacterium piscis]|uniref:Uncharacterized protein n=1 Tax=Flavobacterium piscis TaxID=1114874 RepID=A0ABU1Y886_9FLAO|nr:hypothetical protein [Flavobacterium piscis]